jgi:hypothetical protein
LHHSAFLHVFQRKPPRIVGNGRSNAGYGHRYAGYRQARFRAHHHARDDPTLSRTNIFRFLTFLLPGSNAQRKKKEYAKKQQFCFHKFKKFKKFNHSPALVSTPGAALALKALGSKSQSSFSSGRVGSSLM